MALSKQAKNILGASNQVSQKFGWVVAGRRQKDAFNAPAAKKARKVQLIQGKIDQFRLANSDVKVVNGQIVANTTKR